MEEKINNEVLCILRYKPGSKFLMIDYEPVINTLDRELAEFINLCEDEMYSLDDLIAYTFNPPKLNQLTLHYKYCTEL